MEPSEEEEALKITDVRVREVSIPRIYGTWTADPDQLQPDTDHRRSRYQILELFTDAGPVGLGEVSDMADRMEPLPPDQLRDLLAGQLVGRDLERWRDAFAAVGEALPGDCHPELRGLTLFGVEIALLDLVGKKLGAPLYELLGGRVHDRVDVCWVAYMRGEMTAEAELEALSEEVRGKLAEGIRAFKMKVGGDPGRDLERVRRFREVAGPDTYLRGDASGAWTEEEAVERLCELAAAGVHACETPVDAVSRPVVNDQPERINRDPDGVTAVLARVRERSPIDIIEHVADLDDAFTASVVRHRAVDVVNVIPSQGGGLLRGQRLIHTAGSGGIPVLLGSTVELGPGTAAFVHLAVASANVTVPSDLVSPGLLVDDICATPFEYRHGALEPPAGPGLGVELDEARMAKWAI